VRVCTMHGLFSNVDVGGQVERARDVIETARIEEKVMRQIKTRDRGCGHGARGRELEQQRERRNASASRAGKEGGGVRKKVDEHWGRVKDGV
jgi:hypothetical protein